MSDRVVVGGSLGRPGRGGPIPPRVGLSSNSSVSVPICRDKRWECDVRGQTRVDDEVEVTGSDVVATQTDYNGFAFAESMLLEARADRGEPVNKSTQHRGNVRGRRHFLLGEPINFGRIGCPDARRWGLYKRVKSGIGSPLLRAKQREDGLGWMGCLTHNDSGA